ncbi:Ig-like domain repeat protein [Pseudomarimonas arenosa]|uniref:Ig-like domain repeat protein n=1 Tax=Pseudomarimonas arenosa TaxID=2774145 RepID=A0AAW3ZKG3_9GAMM|nr:Ig-like domain repeat protein [Pseudomarimonas arenosa]MBD8525400.1 Ig-like domain repeat protein [Pseudomarimonas arenosa]
MNSLRVCIAVALCLSAGSALGGAFTASSNTGFPITAVMHPKGYTGSGGNVNNTVCLDTRVLPTGVSAATVEATVQKAVRTWNRQRAVTGNLSLPFGNNDVTVFPQIDYESTLAHEIGHCVGLAHPNLATESGLPSADRNYTQARVGVNTVFDLDAGTDTLKGSSDDVRGDDVNRFWFRKGNNDPMAFPSIIDPSTFSVSLSDLPMGHSYAANGDRDVLNALGYPNTESVMQQGQFNNEAQRRITPEDQSTLRIGMAGVDETQGTGDDYTLSLNYIGQVSSDNACDIQINFNPDGDFAYCSFGATTINSSHLRITVATVSLDRDTDWYFSPTENTQISVSTNPSPPATGTSNTMTVFVDRLFGGMTGTPDGNFEVQLGNQTCTGTLSASDTDTSTGSCSITPSSTGTQTLSALYLGNAGFDASVVSQSVTVGNAAPADQVFYSGFEG